MDTENPIIVWIRRDLRLHDNPTLAAAVATGRPVIPVFILDEVFAGYGACPLWRFGLGAETFAKSMESIGSRLIFRRGPALDVLRELIAETGAEAVFWSRAYDPDQVTRDTAVKSGLAGDGIDAKSVAGHLLFEPWQVATQQGGFYKVYTPFWNSVKNRDTGAPLSEIRALRPPNAWPPSDDPADWQLGADMHRGARVVRRHLNLGEAAAQDRLAVFIDDWVADYRENRDRPGVQGTSGLSENLAWGEISARTCWHAGMRALQDGKHGAETFLKELVWREFAYHLVWHTPHITTKNWRDGWDAFPWKKNEQAPEILVWQQGRTGVPFVDAAMRQMYVTGTMHNRARMIVASYLTKHLLTDWRIGQRWFEQCLIDWDPASNSMGWQWTAGCGPDASPFFRIFNPETQLDKFDRDGVYASRWIAEGQSDPPETALDYFDAIPKGWGLHPSLSCADPLVSLPEGRRRALDAYQGRGF